MESANGLEAYGWEVCGETVSAQSFRMCPTVQSQMISGDMDCRKEVRKQVYWSIAAFKHSDGFDFKEVFGVGEARDQVAVAYSNRPVGPSRRPAHARRVGVFCGSRRCLFQVHGSVSGNGRWPRHVD
jgi:hypothetical protein